MARYTIEIRNGRGDVLATGSGSSDWQKTATRIAAAAGLAGRGDQLVDTYFPTDQGAPWGTHHVQWGRTPRGGNGLTLSNRYVVSVQQA